MDKDTDDNARDLMVTDLDAPLPGEKIKGLHTNFITLYPYALYPWSMYPSIQLICRLEREKRGNQHFPHQLSKVQNEWMRQGKIHEKTPSTTTLAPNITPGQNQKTLDDLPIATLMDVFCRIELLFLAYVVIGTEGHYNPGESRTEPAKPWFSYADYLQHLAYLRERANKGTVKSVNLFQEKEITLRATALGHVKDPVKQLSLAAALEKARQEAGDLWIGIYSDNSKATSPLYVDPIVERLRNPNGKRGAGALGSPATPLGGAKRARQSYFPGTRAPSTAAEKSRDGQAVKIKNPNKIQSCMDRIDCQAEDDQGRRITCTICKAFAHGRGCSNANCGGAHCCDLQNKNTLERCLGDHSRVNCPWNQKP